MNPKRQGGRGRLTLGSKPMNAQDYFAMPGVSSHMLIAMLRSPLHCWATYFDPQRPAEEPTAAQRLGSLIHMVTLTPEQFNDHYELAQRVNRRTAVGKARYEALRAAGKQLVSDQDYRTAMRVRSALFQHPDARALLRDGEPEKVLMVDRTPLLPLKGRLDWLGTPPRITELKTTTDARKARFLSDVYRYGYHVSAAYYRMLASEHTGTPAEAIPHAFVVAETEPPYAVAVYPTPERLLAEGRTLWETQLARFDACWSREEWPGYPSETLETGGGGERLRYEIEEGEIEL